MASHEDPRLVGIVSAVVVIGALFFARVVFIPLAAAILLALLLAPIVDFLERLGIPRIPAVSLVVVGLVAIIGTVIWQGSAQFIDLGDRLPGYERAVREKIHTLKSSSAQEIDKASNSVKDLEKEIGAVPEPQPGESGNSSSPVGSSSSRPLPVEVVPPSNPLASAQNLLGPLATAGVVMVFAFLILLGREDLRNRLIRLAYGGRLNTMTQAMDEAVHRIDRYLGLQLAVNATYGTLVAIALHFIGVPNASLWGLVAAVFRFLPYIGAPLAAVMPIFLALAIFPGWYHALMAAGVFLVLEIVVANAVEPLLYSSHVGLSPLAIVVAAVFWTLIWGFPGLVLSTPLTACLVVMGRYIPSLGFLDILLGNEPVLPPYIQYYQRLLAGDQREAQQIAEAELKESSLDELYASIMIPALGLAEQDRHHGDLDSGTQQFIYQGTREIIEELNDTSDDRQALPQALLAETQAARLLDVLCLPARDDADEIVAALVSQLLERHGQRSQYLPEGSTADIAAQVRELHPKAVCISAMPPFAMNHARSLYATLRAQFPDLQLVVCVWQFEGDVRKAASRLKLAPQHRFMTTLPEVIGYFTNPQETSASPETESSTDRTSEAATTAAGTERSRLP